MIRRLNKKSLKLVVAVLQLARIVNMSKRSLENSYDDSVIKRSKWNSFQLKNNAEYEGSFPVYKQPREINSYSIDHERRVWFDNREMVK